MTSSSPFEEDDESSSSSSSTLSGLAAAAARAARWGRAGGAAGCGGEADRLFADELFAEAAVRLVGYRLPLCFESFDDMVLLSIPLCFFLYFFLIQYTLILLLYSTTIDNRMEWNNSIFNNLELVSCCCLYICRFDVYLCFSLSFLCFLFFSCFLFLFFSSSSISKLYSAHWISKSNYMYVLEIASKNTQQQHITQYFFVAQCNVNVMSYMMRSCENYISIDFATRLYCWICLI